MAFEAGAITGKIGLDEEPAIKSMRDVGKEAQAMKHEVEQASQQAGKSMKESMEEALKSIKGGFGRGSLLGDSLELAAGAGIGMAFGEGASMLNEMVEGVSNAKDEFNQGKISAGEMTEKLAEGIPIIGGFVKAGLGIHELFSGEKAEIEKINEEAAQTKIIFDSQTAAAMDLKQTLADVNAEISHIKTHTANIESNPFDAEIRNANQSSEDVKRALNADENKKIKDVEDATKPWLDTRQAEVNAASDKYTSLQDVDASRREKNPGVAPDAELRDKIDDAKKEYEAAQAMLNAAKRNVESQKEQIHALFAAKDDALKADSDKTLKEILDRRKTFDDALARAGNDEVGRQKSSADQEELRAHQESFQADLQAIRDHAAEIEKARNEAAESLIKDKLLDPAKLP